MKRLWAKVPSRILDDPRWGLLQDDQWKAKMLAFIGDEKNIHCDDNRSEYIHRWSDLRAAVFARDPHECRNCGSTKNLEIDHIKPLARGGSNDLSNLQILCQSCNRRKWAKYG